MYKEILAKMLILCKDKKCLKVNIQKNKIKWFKKNPKEGNGGGRAKHIKYIAKRKYIVRWQMWISKD